MASTHLFKYSNLAKSLAVIITVAVVTAVVVLGGVGVVHVILFP